jgi:hypothetical protein
MTHPDASGKSTSPTFAAAWEFTNTDRDGDCATVMFNPICPGDDVSPAAGRTRRLARLAY